MVQSLYSPSFQLLVKEHDIHALFNTIKKATRSQTLSLVHCVSLCTECCVCNKTRIIGAVSRQWQGWEFDGDESGHMNTVDDYCVIDPVYLVLCYLIITILIETPPIPC